MQRELERLKIKSELLNDINGYSNKENYLPKFIVSKLKFVIITLCLYSTESQHHITLRLGYLLMISCTSLALK
jgi:hypothetical protein